MKNISITGNVRRNLTYRLCPNTEFSIGNWQIGLTTICTEALQDINAFVNITSNVSVSEKYKSGNIVTYEQPLNTIYLNLKKNAKAINRFSTPIYLDMNRQSEEIEFHFYNTLTEQKFEMDVNIALNIQFKRVA